MRRGLLLVIFSILFFTNSLAKDEQKIIQALIYEEYNQASKACMIYADLFKQYKDAIFLEKALFLALSNNLKEKEELLKISKDFLTIPDIARLNALYYFEKNDLKNSKKITLELINKQEDYRNYELLGDIYTREGLILKALEQYNKAYKLFKYENLLLKIVELNIKTNNINQAKNLLEEFHQNNTYSLRTLLILLKIYQNENNIKASILTLNNLYNINPDKKYLYSIVELLIQEKNFEQALKIAQKYNLNPDIQIYLYTQNKNYKKAYEKALFQYQKTQDKKYLSMAAVLEFEQNMDPVSKKVKDKKILNSVLKKFEESVNENSDSLYQNYYGYTLIEYDIDIQRGIELVEWALMQEENNLYYLDSLAWGYYKLKDCKKAYEILNKTLHDKEFSNSKESKEHLKAIKKCLKN